MKTLKAHFEGLQAEMNSHGETIYPHERAMFYAGAMAVIDVFSHALKTQDWQAIRNLTGEFGKFLAECEDDVLREAFKNLGRVQ